MAKHFRTSSKNFWQDQQRIATLIASFNCSIFVIDRDGVINEFLIPEKFPLPEVEAVVIGTTISTILGEEIHFLAKRKLALAFKTGVSQTLNFKRKIHDQENFLEMQLVAVNENEAILILKDISQQIRLAQVQSDFIHRATHDLRAPISTALLMINLLEADIPLDEKREYWGLLKDVLQKESELVEDLLSFGKLENERWIKNVELLNPLEALEKSYRSILPAANQKKLQLDYNAPSNGCRVYADRIALEEVFTNLLSNAVKYTPQDGLVKIECLNGEDQVGFRIQDSGIGISDKDLTLIGSRNYRGKNALESGIEGNGIGMFIVKTIIDHFGGDLRIESELGQGTTVSFWLPKGFVE